MPRYLRQTSLPEIGMIGQKNLSKAKVLCVGAGGLGCPASLYLAASGVGTIGLIDSDKVDLSNLQRQVLFNHEDIGTPKVIAAKKRLQSFNPEIKINIYNERLDFRNIEKIFCNYDIVIDGSDNFETKFLINDACYKLRIPMVYAAVNKFEGQVALFCGNLGSCYRCLNPEFPKAEIRNCVQTGVLGSVVGTIGTLQATLAIQYLISGGDQGHILFPKIGDLTIFDMKGDWAIYQLKVSKNLSCPTCSKSSEKTLLQEYKSASNICTPETTISAEKLISKMRENNSNIPNDILIIDVRETNEWDLGHISSAIHCPLNHIETSDFFKFQNFKGTIVTYCKSGIRSKIAANVLGKKGFSTVVSLAGGIEAWPEKLV